MDKQTKREVIAVLLREGKQELVRAWLTTAMVPKVPANVWSSEAFYTTGSSIGKFAAKLFAKKGEFYNMVGINDMRSKAGMVGIALDRLVPWAKEPDSGFIAKEIKEMAKYYDARSLYRHGEIVAVVAVDRVRGWRFAFLPSLEHAALFDKQEDVAE